MQLDTCAVRVETSINDIANYFHVGVIDNKSYYLIATFGKSLQWPSVYWPIEHVSTFSSLFDRVYKNGACISYFLDIFQDYEWKMLY